MGYEWEEPYICVQDSWPMQGKLAEPERLWVGESMPEGWDPRLLGAGRTDSWTESCTETDRQATTLVIQSVRIAEYYKAWHGLSFSF